MTLVLSCLTRDYLFQVSDRRLVKVFRKGGIEIAEIAEDNANKNVFYFGSIAFSYTGLAEIEGKGTDDWLLDILPESFEQTARVIVERATEAFRNINLPSVNKRHAFVGVGWLSNKKGGPVVPTFVSISNFQGPDGEHLSSAGDKFTAYGWNLPDNKSFLVFPVGQPIPTPQFEALQKSIKTAVKRKKGPTAILGCLVAAMRETAQNNDKVGKNFLALCLPKAAAGKQGIANPFVERKIQHEENTFLYFPFDAVDGVLYGPSCKFAGWKMKQPEVRFF